MIPEDHPGGYTSFRLNSAAIRPCPALVDLPFAVKPYRLLLEANS